MLHQPFLSPPINIKLNEEYKELIRLRDERVLLDTPQGKGYISEFAAIGGELDAKFHFVDSPYHNYYSVYQSIENSEFHFGFVMTPVGDGSDPEGFIGVWKAGDKEYTKDEFNNKFKRVIL